jgi:long-chain acyl-CoA synthetase
VGSLIPQVLLTLGPGRDATPALQSWKGSTPAETLSWRDYVSGARSIGAALIQRGLKRGDRVAIISKNRPEWVLTEMGAWCAGAVVVPVHAGLPQTDIDYILRDCAPSFVFVDDPKTVVGLAGEVGVVRYDGSFADFLRAGSRDELEELDARSRALCPGDRATIVYTSGTTGLPRGVVLTHGNCLAQCTATDEVWNLAPDDVAITLFPLAHMLGRTVNWRSVCTGFVTHYADYALAHDLLGVIRPTILPGVPRFYEKLLTAFGISAESLDETRDREILKAKTGGRVRVAYCVSAGLSPTISALFHRLGFALLEGFGLTEAAGGVTTMYPAEPAPGTVGRPFPGLELKLAEDGEILVRGPTVMEGYHGLPEETAAVLGPDGWLRTGDLGRLDAAGRLVFVDRKKELIKTSTGKQVAPQKVEGLLREIPGVTHAVLFGNERKFCVALLEVDERNAPDDLGGAIARINERLAPHERVARFALLSEPLRPGEELTSALKIKRSAVQKRYRSVIDSLYENP